MNGNRHSGLLRINSAGNIIRGVTASRRQKDNSRLPPMVFILGFSTSLKVSPNHQM